MYLAKLYVMSFSCILSLHYAAQGAERNELRPNKKDALLASSTIYQIKRYQPSVQKPQQKLVEQQPSAELQSERQQQQQQQQQQQHQQQQQQQQTSEDLSVKSSRGKKMKTLTKNTHTLNKKLLNKLGLSKVRAPNSHNRKRLAVESRRHASPDDSHMFIIKLPPNLYYYTSPKAASHAKNSLEPNANGKKVSFPFSSNGKPGRVYHWNLPAIKKILEDKTRFSSVASAAKDQLTDIRDVPTWTKPWENETVEKSYGGTGMMGLKKSLKRKSPSYYAPTHSVNKNSFNKYFPGNGKPKGFYVIKENQKKPLYYKNIVA